MAVRPDGAPGLLIAPDGLVPERSLGWQVAHWAESLLCHGPGDIEGTRLELDDELRAFVALAYSVGENGRRLVFEADLSRAKGRAKSELAGVIVCAEALAPVRFDHWAVRGETSWWGYEYEPGEPVGRPVRWPFIRCLATEQGQAGNTYGNVTVMLEYLMAGHPDLFGRIDIGRGAQGSTRVFLPEGGEIRPCTAGGASKDGGKESFAVADEKHLYVLPELHDMYLMVSKNLVKRRTAEPWMLGTSTMYDPAEGSVAQVSHEHAESIEQGRVRNRGVLYDHREAPELSTEPGDDGSPSEWDDDDLQLASLEVAYGSFAENMDLDRIVAEIRHPKTKRATALRYFHNRRSEAAGSWLEDSVVTLRSVADRLDVGCAVALGFDGSDTDDSTALSACRMSDGRVFCLHVWEHDGTSTWRVPRAEVDSAVRMAMVVYRVARCYVDPPYWRDELREWQQEWPELVLPFETNRPKPMGAAVENFETGMKAGRLTVGVADDDFGGVLVRHLRNARKVRDRGYDRLVKPTDARKIDAAVAAVLADQARADALAAGWTAMPAGSVYEGRGPVML